MTRVGAQHTEAGGAHDASPPARGATAAKAAYVRAAGQTRSHTCHWPGCGMQVPPAMWGCKKHWFMLPAQLRTKVWAAYRPGQEAGLVRVSDAYLDAAREVQQWIQERGR